MTPLRCALCGEPLVQETERREPPFLKLSGSHVAPSECAASTTWVYIWKPAEFWADA